MNLRVTLVGKVKYLRYEAEVKASLNRAVGVNLCVYPIVSRSRRETK